MLKLRPIIAGIAAISCAACVEIDGVLVIKPDGSAVNRIEVRIASAVVRDLDREAAKAKRNATGTHDEQASFADMCKALAEPSTLPSDAEAKAPRVPTTATVGTRGTWTTCTIVETIADPADYYTRIAEAYGYASPDERFERLPSNDGYRYSSSVRFSQLFDAAFKGKDEDKKVVAELAALVPATARLRFAIKGQRIADTDGKLDADGKTARWTFPLRQLLDLSGDAKPLASRALIHFR